MCTTSSFGIELCAMNQYTEYVRGLRYKLWMMGIPGDELTFLYGDNQSVLLNTTMPESVLKNKTQSIDYRHVKEVMTLDECRMAYINTHDNVFNMMTKPVPSGEKRW